MLIFAKNSHIFSFYRKSSESHSSCKKVCVNNLNLKKNLFLFARVLHIFSRKLWENIICEKFSHNKNIFLEIFTKICHTKSHVIRIFARKWSICFTCCQHVLTKCQNLLFCVQIFTKISSSYIFAKSFPKMCKMIFAPASTITDLRRSWNKRYCDKTQHHTTFTSQNVTVT